MSHIFLSLLLLQLRCTRFADCDMFVWFTGGGIGHQNTASATRIFHDALRKLFGINFHHDASNDQDTTGPDDSDNPELKDSSDAPKDEESEDDIDDDVESTDFEDDGGECGADKEAELGFSSF